MTRLILIRHAKSGWDDPFADDHARVLTKRGRTASAAIGDWMAANEYQPDIVLVSDAARTVETAEVLLARLPKMPEITWMPSLYHASPDTILDALVRQSAATVAVIAHNPGMGMLADHLAAKRPAHRRFADYPTCATTVLDFTNGIIGSGGQVTDFVVPRDLLGSAGADTD